MPTTRRQCCPVLPPGSTERLEQQTFVLKLNLDNFLGLHMHPGDIGEETTESYVQFYRYVWEKAGLWPVSPLLPLHWYRSFTDA